MRERDFIISDARSNFEEFVRRHDTQYLRNNPEEASCLQEYLMAWLENGNGVELTGRNYETYLHVVIDIADAAFRGELNFNYAGREEADYADRRERRIAAIHDETLAGAEALTRSGYEVTAYRREHSGKGILFEDLPREIVRPDV